MSHYAPSSTHYYEDEDVDRYEYDLRGSASSNSRSQSQALCPYRPSNPPRSTNTSLMRQFSGTPRSDRPVYDEESPPSRSSRASRPTRPFRPAYDDAEEEHLDAYMDRLSLDYSPRCEREQAPSRSCPTRERKRSSPLRSQRSRLSRNEWSDDSPLPTCRETRAHPSRPTHDADGWTPLPPRERRRNPGLLPEGFLDHPRERTRRTVRGTARSLHADTSGPCDCDYSYRSEAEAAHAADCAGDEGRPHEVWYCKARGMFGIEPW
jgi:hypothetical protein